MNNQGGSMNYNLRLGELIKERRKKLKICQVKLAKNLSIGQSTLSKIERGQLSVSSQLLFRIKKALKFTVKEMKILEINAVE